MKNVFLISCLFSLLAFIGYAQDDSDIIHPGEQMPAFHIVSDDGKIFSSSALQGKVVLINFFCNLVSSLSERAGGCRGPVVACFSGK